MRTHRRLAGLFVARSCAVAVAVAIVGSGVFVAVAPPAGADVNSTTTTIVATSPAVLGNPITVGGDVNCGPVIVPTGTISVFVNNGANPVGSASLDANGVGTVDVTNVLAAQGSYTVRAEYSGDTNCAASVSPNRTLVVTGSSMTLTTGVFRTLGFPIQLTADVSCGARIPTGSVSFFQTGVVGSIGNAPLGADGLAVFDATSLVTTTGDYTFHATYPGDGSCTAATSTDKTVVVLSQDPIDRYVDFVYQYLFGRTADPDGLEYWSTLIRGGVNRSALSWALVTSVEHRSVVIDDTFEKYFGRPADPSGKQFFLNATGSGLSFLYIDLFIVGSDEYYNDAGGTNTAFLNTVYGDLLHRAPDASGLAYGLVTLGNGTPRSQFSGGLVFSDEYLGQVIDGLYMGIFGRHVDPSGRAYWTSQMQHGMPVQVLVALLVGSDELFHNLTGR